MILIVKVKISYFSFNAEYANFNTLENVDFNIHLSNHRKDAKSEKSILAYKHSNEPNHNFQQHAEFTLMEQIREKRTTEKRRKLLKIRENFRILKLKALYAHGLNQELNDIE